MTREHDVGDQPRMPTVAVGEAVDRDQAVVKARRRFVERVGAMLDPVARVGEEIPQPRCDLLGRDAEIPFRSSERACPAPGLVEHAAMELAQELLAEDVPFPGGDEPGYGARHVGLLPLVELFLRRDVRGQQPFDLVRIEGRCPRSLRAA